MLVITQLQVIIALGLQSLLDQALHLAAHPFPQFLVKEFFPLGKVQLKMSTAEDFQFSHRVYLLLVSWRSKKMYTLLFCFQAKSTHKNLRYRGEDRVYVQGGGSVSRNACQFSR